MTTAVATRWSSKVIFAPDAALRAAVRLWFLTAVIGQLLFVGAVASFYVSAAVRGNLDAWNRFMTHGYVPGDGLGNVIVAIHLMSAVVIILAGTIQILPRVRQRAPSLHRWNGRLYVVTAFTISLAGLYMMWIRGSVGDLPQHLGSSLMAVLIMLCAGMALRSALARDFETHRRWALRLYLVVSASLFIRAGIFLATLLNHGPFGFVAIVAMGIGALAARGFRLPFRGQGIRLTDVLSRTIEAEGIDAGVAQYRRLRDQGFPDLRERESETNGLGCALLSRGDKESAIRVLQLNVETHPKSANAHDSLGEAYVAAGHTVLAVESYEKAVAINPKMKTAASALQTLSHRKRKPYRPMVLFHICAGALALLSGTVAISLRKGSRRHAAAGNVLVVSMLSMSATGAYMAFVSVGGEVVNVLMGLLTFYLVTTAWWTARRRDGRTGVLDWGALLAALSVATGLVSQGLEAANSETGVKGGASAGLYFFFGGVALLAAALDLRMIVGGGAFGAQRIARHLWRMCAAFFIGVTSLFLGQPQVFPAALRNTGVLVGPSVLVLGLLIFWLIRVSFTNAYGRPARPRHRTSDVVGLDALGRQIERAGG
jgi:uncharacterized membrane protein